jgi:FAD-dependent oxidoreductase domain-containing protein 1
VIIVGGGIMGCSTAYHLMNSGNKLRVVVIEKDPTYSQASTTLCVGNIRILFNLKENIQISQYAFEVMERFKDEMAVNDDKPNVKLRGEGNLHLVDEKGRREAEEEVALQKSLGCKVDWWSPERIKECYPLFNVEPYAGGKFGYKDGVVDPYSVLMGYRAKARSLGAEFVKDEVVQITTSGKRVTGVRLASGSHLTAAIVVNCAGAWAPKLAETAGIKVPVMPIKRQVFLFKPGVESEKLLHANLPSGLYFTSETGGLIICGKSMEDDPVGFDFTWDRKRFTEILWPELAEFIPAFDTLKLIKGWAGLYDVNTLDAQAILGEWPELNGFFLATGFSGHGFQQGPAVGRYLCELITGQKPTLDLSVFGPERILENRPLTRNRII